MRTLLLALLLTGLQLSCEEAPDRPNIILILADDFGYMDSQVYAERTLGVDRGAMYYETPHINRLAAEGIAFSRAYANQLCSPTRVAIMTGKYAGRLGFTTATGPCATYYNQDTELPEGQYPHDVIYHSDPIPIEQAWLNASSNTALPAGTSRDKGWDEISIAEALPGYHSAFIGKWHIGGHGAEGYQPADHGFEPIAWFDAGGSFYFNWREGWNNRSTARFPEMPQEEWLMGDAGEETGEEYLTDDLTEQALSYLDRRASINEQPFFLYFCHFAVHGPWQAKAADTTYFADKESRGWNGHKDPRYAGMVRGLDRSVGRILDKLAETGLEENTLVIFMSDNGGWDGRVTRDGMATSCAPLRGGKACLSEGGIRVPLIFRWKGKTGEGAWCDVPVDCTDLFPTILQAAGVDPETWYSEADIDGRSLMPLLDDPANSDRAYDHDTRYWHYPFNVSVYSPFDRQFLTPRSAIMEKNFKLIFDWHGTLRLFDLEADPEENHNLVSVMPEKTLELYGKLINWLEEEVDRQYWPVLNPDYNPEKEVRSDAPFVDLYQAYKEGKDILKLSHTGSEKQVPNNN
ncbi:MAG: sulfatase [Bacteroidota bacterium]